MIDLTKLTPAPWRSERRFSNGCEIVPRVHCEPGPGRECGWVADLVGAPYLGYESTLVNAEFIVLARNAFDVMMRRGWHATSTRNKVDDSLVWTVDHYTLSHRPFEGACADPFTALIEAEAWYVANVETPP